MSQLFYLIRHGETDWNVLRRLQGHSDIELNTAGRLQAQNLKYRMRQTRIDRVVSSDLQRAVQTAELAFETQIQTTPDLREVHLGLAEGLTRELIIEKKGEEFWQQWASHLPEFLDHRFDGGESKRETLTRLFQCFQAELGKSPTSTVAFVSHGLAMRTLTHHLKPDLQETHFIANCGVLKLAYDPKDGFEWLDYFDSSQDIR